MLCHLPLFLPIFGLVLFLFFPLPVAVPLYLVVVGISYFLFKKTVDIMRKPVCTGKEGLIGLTCKIVEVDESGTTGIVQVLDEYWRAKSDEGMRIGEKMVVKGFDGSTILLGK